MAMFNSYVKLPEGTGFILQESRAKKTTKAFSTGFPTPGRWWDNIGNWVYHTKQCSKFLGMTHGLLEKTFTETEPLLEI